MAKLVQLQPSVVMEDNSFGLLGMFSQRKGSVETSTENLLQCIYLRNLRISRAESYPIQESLNDVYLENSFALFHQHQLHSRLFSASAEVLKLVIPELESSSLDGKLSYIANNKYPQVSVKQ